MNLDSIAFMEKEKITLTISLIQYSNDEAKEVSTCVFDYDIGEQSFFIGFFDQMYFGILEGEVQTMLLGWNYEQVQDLNVFDFFKESFGGFSKEEQE